MGDFGALGPGGAEAKSSIRWAPIRFRRKPPLTLARNSQYARFCHLPIKSLIQGSTTLYGMSYRVSCPDDVGAYNWRIEVRAEPWRFARFFRRVW